MIRRSAAIENVTVVIPFVAVIDVNKMAAGIRRNDIPRENASHSELIFPVTFLLFIIRLEESMPSRVVLQLSRIVIKRFVIGSGFSERLALCIRDLGEFLEQPPALFEQLIESFRVAAERI